MADLTEQQSSIAAKITGADATGVETNYLGVTANQDAQVVERSNIAGIYGAITVGATAKAIQVGVSPLANRKAVIATNNSNTTLYWGYDASVTTATGLPWFKSQQISWAHGPNVVVYAIAGSSGNDVRVMEAS